MSAAKIRATFAGRESSPCRRRGAGAWPASVLGGAQPSFALGLYLALLGSLIAAGDIEAQERLPGHLVTHNEVLIDRPASVIWPYIVDPLDWKQGQRLRHLSGNPGEVGELLGGYDAETPELVTLHLQNVELRPYRRRTVKLMQPDGTLLGFATWRLVEEDGRTTVSYAVSMESGLPSGPVTGHDADEVEAMERAAYEANVRRFQAELEALKALVEGR